MALGRASGHWCGEEGCGSEDYDVCLSFMHAETMTSVNVPFFDQGAQSVRYRCGDPGQTGSVGRGACDDATRASEKDSFWVRIPTREKEKRRTAVVIEDPASNVFFSPKQLSSMSANREEEKSILYIKKDSYIHTRSFIHLPRTPVLSRPPKNLSA